MSARVVLAASILLGACSIDQGPYEPSIDASAGRVVVNPSPAQLTEGRTTDVFVHVENPPTLPANVVCWSSDFPRLQMEPAELVFTASGSDQIVTLEAQEDPDALDDQLMVSCAAEDLDLANTNVVVIDNDVLAIVPVPDGAPPIAVAEMQSTNIAVTLSAQPPTTIVVSVAHGGTEINTAPVVLTFTPQNYSTPQNVIVTGVHDADTTTDPDTVTLMSTGLTPISVPISVTDID